MEARKEVERLTTLVSVLERDCEDLTCHACSKCCDAALADIERWKRAAVSQNRQWSVKCVEATELRAEVERLQTERHMLELQFESAKKATEAWADKFELSERERLTAERDEALAMVERLREILKNEMHESSLAQERDEARAEVERLTKEVGRVMNEKAIQLGALEAEITGAHAEIEALLDAVKASHETGCWGPAEDAYAASGRPALRHRSEVERLCNIVKNGVIGPIKTSGEGKTLNNLSTDSIIKVGQ
jgi:DNA repair exonuclease SbcCD ATPase subunit